MKLPFKLTPDRISILLTLIDYKIHEQNYYRRISSTIDTPNDNYVKELTQMAVELAQVIDTDDHDAFLFSNVHLVRWFLSVDGVMMSPDERIKFAKERLEKLASANGASS
jgi:hypothetical protein